MCVFWDRELDAAAHLAGPDVAGHELLHRPVLLFLVLEVHPRDPILVPVGQPDPENSLLRTRILKGCCEENL